MASSAKDSPPRHQATVELGACLTGTEAKRLADALDAGESLTTALRAVDQVTRAGIRQLINEAGLDADHGRLASTCRGIEGAKSGSTSVDPLWTLPGQLAQTSPLTSSIPSLVQRARTSVVCSTFNFQQSSALWTTLRDVAQQPQVIVRVYVDTAAAQSNQHRNNPSVDDIATHLHPGRVYRTRELNGSLVRNHAKYLVVDHRFVLVTSANFSRSAELRNVELGVLIDSVGLAEVIERELAGVQDQLYERVKPVH